MNQESLQLLGKSQEMQLHKKAGECFWKWCFQSGVISVDPIQVGAVSFDPAQHSIQIHHKN